MIEVMLWCAIAALGQEPAAPDTPTTWAELYLDTAKQYRLTRRDDGEEIQFQEDALFEWASIDDFHGAVFAWSEKGRPAMVATIFSFPQSDLKQRLLVHEFASFAEAEVALAGPSKIEWKPPQGTMQPVPGAKPPPGKEKQLTLHCRRLAKEFSASLNRRGERWDLRLLPTPLIEYYEPREDILGGALFAFVGYSTDPEILLLLEARKSKGGPTWYFQPVRFSDKSLFLSFQDKSVWESLRAGHGSKGPDTEDPLYRMLSSTRLAPDVIDRLSKDKASGKQ